MGGSPLSSPQRFHPWPSKGFLRWHNLGNYFFGWPTLKFWFRRGSEPILISYWIIFKKKISTKITFLTTQSEQLVFGCLPTRRADISECFEKWENFWNWKNDKFEGKKLQEKSQRKNWYAKIKTRAVEKVNYKWEITKNWTRAKVVDTMGSNSKKVRGNKFFSKYEGSSVASTVSLG